MRALLLLLLLTLATPVLAADGVYEISQTCAVQTGCFPGDTAGFPVTIDSVGSYRLTTNLAISEVSEDAVRVAADGVAIDLNGFAIIGPVVCSGSPLSCSPERGSGSGILFTNLNGGSSVRNGTIRGMGGFGVRGQQAEVVDLKISWSGRDGINLSQASFIANTTVDQNSADGIFAGTGSVVTNNSASRNGRDGIVGFTRSIITGNSAKENESGGIRAFAGSLVSDNIASGSGLWGIFAGSGTNVLRNTAPFNQWGGISCESGCVIADSTAYKNGGGVTSANGIECREGCVVRGNSVTFNSGFGIHLGVGSVYSDNAVADNSVGTVVSGLNMGGNSCDGKPICP